MAPVAGVRRGAPLELRWPTHGQEGEATMSTTTLGIGWTPTPVGEVRFAVGEAGALVALGFREQWEALVRRLERRFGPTALVPTSHAAQVGVAIDRYLAGNLSA